jgi:hypothetical protein
LLGFLFTCCQRKVVNFFERCKKVAHFHRWAPTLKNILAIFGISHWESYSDAGENDVGLKAFQSDIRLEPISALKSIPISDLPIIGKSEFLISPFYDNYGLCKTKINFTIRQYWVSPSILGELVYSTIKPPFLNDVRYRILKEFPIRYST